MIYFFLENFQKKKLQKIEKKINPNPRTKFPEKKITKKQFF